MKTFQYYIIFLLLCFSSSLLGKNTISGKVLDKKTKEAIPYANFHIVEQDLWTTSDQDGTFTIDNIQSGNFTISITCLGYIELKEEYSDIASFTNEKVFYLSKNNLELNEVVVTAKRNENALATSYVIDKNAMNHLQSSTVADIMSQLPGSSTTDNQDLTADQTIGIREENNDMDNSTFGTAIEVDGIRLSNNSNYNDNPNELGISGTSINNLSTSNIESIEIVTGLPSVEYGDLSSGLVSIKTKKGHSPFEIEVNLKPKIKSYSLQKGVNLDHNRGTFNFSLEHTRSFKDRASPYKTYSRNNLNLVYSNEVDLFNIPLNISSTLAGNIGGLNDESDPDYLVDTYEKKSDNTIRGGLQFNYLLNRSWISNIELKGSVNYSNKKESYKTAESSSSSTALIRSTEESYSIGVDYDDDPDANIVVIDSGYWTQNRMIDNKPIDYNLALKVGWSRNFGQLNNNFKMGASYTYSGNYGSGEYYEDMRYTKTSYREYRYDQQPFVNNLALYAEDKITFPVFKRDLQIQGGIRNDITFIKDSEYGKVSSISPRTNLKYAIIENGLGSIQKMSFHAGIGEAVKLPSSSILYPREKYSDELVFSGKTDDIANKSYPAYYTYPSTAKYNPDLKYQRTRKMELGLDFTTKFARLSITAYHDKTFNPYKNTRLYSAFTYRITDNSALEDCIIPSEDHIYSINDNTGVVTVSDAMGIYNDQDLRYSEQTKYLSNYFYSNGSSNVIKKGIDWVINFQKIKALNTSIRWDGSFSYYKGLDDTLEEYLPYSGTGSDGNNYKYLAYYSGGYSSSNGSISKRIKSNITFITHIPQLRLIMTLRVEAMLYNSQQSLSEYSAGTRSYVLDGKNDYLPSEGSSDIYAGDQYVALYPEYYSSNEDPNTKSSFYEDLLWAAENDPNLYKDLAKMVKKTPYTYSFNERRYSPYVFANLNITKEIGDKVSLSFLANNFLNNLGQVNNSQTGKKESLYQSSFMPSLYYGFSLRLKL